MCGRLSGWEGSATAFICGSSCLFTESIPSLRTLWCLRSGWLELLIIWSSSRCCACGKGGSPPERWRVRWRLRLEPGAANNLPAWKRRQGLKPIFASKLYAALKRRSSTLPLTSASGCAAFHRRLCELTTVSLYSLGADDYLVGGRRELEMCAAGLVRCDCFGQVQR